MLADIVWCTSWQWFALSGWSFVAHPSGISVFVHTGIDLIPICQLYLQHTQERKGLKIVMAWFCRRKRNLTNSVFYWIRKITWTEIFNRSWVYKKYTYDVVNLKLDQCSFACFNSILSEIKKPKLLWSLLTSRPINVRNPHCESNHFIFFQL